MNIEVPTYTYRRVCCTKYVSHLYTYNTISCRGNECNNNNNNKRFGAATCVWGKVGARTLIVRWHAARRLPRGYRIYQLNGKRCIVATKF